MDRIPSFSKNHNTLSQGLHICGTSHDVTTWDLRFKKPNTGDYIKPDALHSIEHILATVLRNSVYKDDIIYFGPMGCRTGFYLLTVKLNYDEVKALLLDSIDIALTLNEVPGAKQIECGNYLEHDLDGSKTELIEYQKILKSI
jgi:S-ribosylhomocysteine lyase